MKNILTLAIKSLLNRRLASGLTIMSIAFSVALLLTVEMVRSNARSSFANTISQTDLIVGARSGSLQLLLYSVFHIGTASNNISMETYQHFKNHPAVDWTIPLSMGDSHRGYRVVATNNDFFTKYRYRKDRGIEFAAGSPLSAVLDVVIGSEVASKLGYQLDQKIVLAHGIADHAVVKHEDKPFRIVGILASTATPVDRSLYINLEGMEAIHMDWTDGAPPPSNPDSPSTVVIPEKIEVSQITAFLLRTKTRIETLRLQREINNFPDEAMMAIIPGVALNELWDGLSYAETALSLIAAFVVVVGLLGMLISLFQSLNERRREMAIFRTIGASPLTVGALLTVESFSLSLVGTTLGAGLCYGVAALLQPWIENSFGLHIGISGFNALQWIYCAATVALGSLLGVLPGIRAYRNALHDGLSLRV
jgi:putative ABC transport system permease protein